MPPAGPGAGVSVCLPSPRSGFRAHPPERPRPLPAARRGVSVDSRGSYPPPPGAALALTRGVDGRPGGRRADWGAGRGARKVPIVSYVRGAPEYRGTAGSDAERCFAPRSFPAERGELRPQHRPHAGRSLLRGPAASRPHGHRTGDGRGGPGGHSLRDPARRPSARHTARPLSAHSAGICVNRFPFAFPSWRSPAPASAPSTPRSRPRPGEAGPPPRPDMHRGVRSPSRTGSPWVTLGGSTWAAVDTVPAGVSGATSVVEGGRQSAHS
jgi:hypothetical protein